MEPKFEVRTPLNRPAVKAYFRLFMRTRMQSVTIGMPIVCLLSLALIVISLSTGNFDVKLPVLVLIALLISMILLPIAMHRELIKNVKDENVLNVYSFFDDSFSVVTPVENLTSQYSVFYEFIEDAAYYYLFVNKNSAHILRKSDFTLGSPDDFCAFIEEKTGKKVRFIR